MCGHFAGRGAAWLASLILWAFTVVFAVFLGVYASAVIKGAALLLAQIMPVPVWLLVWIVALLVAAAIYMGGLRGVLYTEAMQGFVMLVGICMLTVAVFDKVGGPVEGMARLAELAPTATANTGFVSLADGGQGWFIISLVIVTSVAVWAMCPSWRSFCLLPWLALPSLPLLRWVRF